MPSNAELDRLASRVRAATRDGGLIETAQVKLVGLDEVRVAAGARWPRMREQVRDGSIKIIASRLGREDAVIPCGDGFLVVFAAASPEVMQRICTEMREALLGFYLGEDALKSLRADVERDTLTAANLAGLVSQADPAAHIRNQRNDLQLGRFWPVWSTRRQAIAAHLCAPAFERTGQSRLGYTPDFVEKATHVERDYLDLDLCLLEQACAAAEQYGSALVGLSVHATTMQKRKSRQVYLDHLATNALALQRMFVMVAEIEPGTPLISLSEWTNALRHTFSRIAFNLHHADRAISAMGSAGVWAAGYHLPPAIGPGAHARETLAHLHVWCRTLRQQGVHPFVTGFEDEGFLDLASCSDLSFATGDPLWPAQALPSALDLSHPKANALLQSAPAP